MRVVQDIYSEYSMYWIANEKRKFTMTEIVLCNTPQNPESLNSQCGINADEIMSLSHHNSPVINSYTPYLVGQNPTTVDKNIRLVIYSFWCFGANLYDLGDIHSE